MVGGGNSSGGDDEIVRKGKRAGCGGDGFGFDKNISGTEGGGDRQKQEEIMEGTRYRIQSGYKSKKLR